MLIVLFGFLFVTVSSRLTGEIGSSSNPISGMTVATLLLTCLIFLLLGWTDRPAMLTALTVAAVVCIASSNGGTTSQDLKTGYLVGATPRKQQLAILVGAVTSALVIGVTMLAAERGGRALHDEGPAAADSSPSPTTLRDRWSVGPMPRTTRTSTTSFTSTEDEYEGVEPGRYLVDDRGRGPSTRPISRSPSSRS